MGCTANCSHIIVSVGSLPTQFTGCAELIISLQLAGWLAEGLSKKRHNNNKKIINRNTKQSEWDWKLDSRSNLSFCQTSVTAAAELFTRQKTLFPFPLMVDCQSESIQDALLHLKPEKILSFTGLLQRTSLPNCIRPTYNL